jgi:hypothetical protein
MCRQISKGSRFNVCLTPERLPRKEVGQGQSVERRRSELRVVAGEDGDSEEGEVLEAVLLSGFRSDDPLLLGSELLLLLELGEESSRARHKEKETEKSGRTGLSASGHDAYIKLSHDTVQVAHTPELGD